MIFSITFSQFFPSKIWQFRFLPYELLWPSLTHSVTQSLMYPVAQKLCNRVFFLLSLNSTITLCTVNYERKHLLKFWLTFSFDSFNFNVVFLYLRWFNKCYVADVLLFCGLSVSVYMCAWLSVCLFSHFSKYFYLWPACPSSILSYAYKNNQKR